MKTICILLFTGNILLNGLAQCPDSLVLTSQAEIDAFALNYPGCTQIEGNVIIFEPSRPTSIQNLNGLINLTHIGGDLILHYCALLDDLSGLENLTTIGGDLNIAGNWFWGIGLDSLSGLGNLTSVGGSVIIDDHVTSLEPLNNLTSIGGDLEIIGGYYTSLSGLENITSVPGYLRIQGDSLASLSGLDNLNAIGGELKIYGCDELTSLSELGNLEMIGGDLTISNNSNLVSLSGLDNIDAGSIDNLEIYGNISLSACEALSLCEYLANPNGIINVYFNAPGCNSPADIASACGITMSCLPYGNYHINSQAEIDSFQEDYPGCTDLEGDVFIGEDYYYSPDITSLDGLSNVQTIGGDLLIVNCDSLEDLSGLNNLTFVGGNLRIDADSSLTSLSGLNNLSSTGGNMFIANNQLLENLSGLQTLDSIGGSLWIGDNNSIEDLSGLNNLTSVNDLRIYGSYFLTTISGFNNLTSLGYLSLESNWGLQNLSGLSNLNHAEGIQFLNSSLESVSGLENLTSIGAGGLTVVSTALDDFTDFENLTTLSGSLNIGANPELTSLSGLDGLDGGTIGDLTITFNSLLSDCAIQSICDYLASPNGIVAINDNASGCSSQEEVESACEVGLEENGTIDNNQLHIYPNPASDRFIVEVTTDLPANTTLAIFDINGRLIEEREITGSATEINAAGLKPGVYFLRITNDRAVQVEKLIRQ